MVFVDSLVICARVAAAGTATFLMIWNSANIQCFIFSPDTSHTLLLLLATARLELFVQFLDELDMDTSFEL